MQSGYSSQFHRKNRGCVASIDAQQKYEYRCRHECDRDATASDQDATVLSRCEELAGSAPKIVTPMRSMATDRVDVFGPTRDVAK